MASHGDGARRLQSSVLCPLSSESLPASALVLLSGGQDSSTCVFWALSPDHGAFDRVEAIAFAYGQRHSVELHQAAVVARIAGVPLTVLDLMSSLGESVAG